MYQIKTVDGRRLINGHEIQVIGRGENGLCRIVDGNGVVKHTATHAECERWLRERAMLAR